MSALRFRMIKSRHVVIIVSAFFVTVLANTLINYGMSSAFPEIYKGTSATSYAQAAGGGISGGLYAFLAFAVVPAICEEFLFRSIITAEFECAGVSAAVIFSALTFAMSHSSIVRLPVYFVSGLVLVFVLYVTRSVIASMIVHMAANTVALFFEDLVYKVVNRQGIVLFIFIVSVTLMVSVTVMFGEAEKIYSKYGVLNESSDYRPGKKEKVSVLEVLFSPAFLALVVFYIVISAVL